MTQFQAGDEVWINSKTGPYPDPKHDKIGKKGIIERVGNIELAAGKCWDTLIIIKGTYYLPSDVTLTSRYNLTNKMKNTSIISRFINKNLKEPEKTYRKLGITDNQDMATQDGKDLYLNYLLRNDPKFFDEIAAPMLAEVEAEDKK